MTNLPEDFIKRMKALMGEEFEPFISSYDDSKIQGLRVNTSKISIENFLEINPFSLERIPWVKEGFYYSSEDRPGKHPYHECGLYYIQEPSAMAVGSIASPYPGERVLDLCAAPGGKSTHLAACLAGRGLLVSNEIHPARARILSQNIERMGIKNCVVTNETPERLAERFVEYFHRILVDAPCSGEGMFRKDEEARREWSLDNVVHCSIRQRDILENAAKMLMAGGTMIYSTCTFSPEENERTIDRFLKEHREFELVEIHNYPGFDRGRPDWAEACNEELSKTVRLWPHRLKGEGHFIAALRKKEGKEENKLKKSKNRIDKDFLKEYFNFARENLNVVPEGDFISFGENLYIVPEEMLSLENIKVLRAGWQLGMVKKNRFEPAHAFALSLKQEEVKHNISLKLSSNETLAYLRGESFKTLGEKGWNLVNIDGYSIGWGKVANDTLKNHYPKGIRWV